jgi:hypothetical protein
MDKIFESKLHDLQPNISHETKLQIEMSAHLVKNLDDLTVNFWISADKEKMQAALKYFEKKLNITEDGIIEIEMEKMGDVGTSLIKSKDRIMSKKSDIIVVIVRGFQKALEKLYNQSYQDRTHDFNMMLGRWGHDHDQNLAEDIERKDRDLYEQLGKFLEEGKKRLVIVTCIDSADPKDKFSKAALKTAYSSSFKKEIIDIKT